MKQVLTLLVIVLIGLVSYYTGHVNGQASVYEKYEKGPGLEELYSEGRGHRKE